MALSKPNNRYSKVISWPVWPDIRPGTLGDLAADHRADQQTALQTASGLRRAYHEVMAEEKGYFADASVRAYTQEESGWRDLAAFRGSKVADVEAWASIGQNLMLTLMGIDDEAHAAIEAKEAMRSSDPAGYGAFVAETVQAAEAAAQAASAAAVAAVEAIVAKIPENIFTKFNQPNGQGSQHKPGEVTAVKNETKLPAGKGEHKETTKQHAGKEDTGNGSEMSSDHDSKAEHKETAKELDSKGQGTAASEASGDHRADAGSGSAGGQQQPGIGSAAGQGLGQAASPLSAAGGGSQAGSGSGSGSGASGLGGLGRHGGASGLGNVGSAPKAPPAAASPASGGPVSDFAKGFTSGASAAGAPPAAPARPLLPAEGARPPMTSQMGALSSTPQNAAVQGTVSSAANAAAGQGVQPVAPVGAVGGAPAGGSGGSGPLPPFGSDLKGAGGAAAPAAPGSTSSGASTTPAGGAGSQQGGTGAPAAMLSGATAAGAGGTRMAEKYATVDLTPAQRLVWEFLHSCGNTAWLTDWAVGVFERRGGGTQLLFATNEGQGFVPSTVVLPTEVLPAMTDPVLPTDFLRRWFGWQDVTRLMLEYGAVRAAAGDGALLGLATSGSITAAERVDVPVLFADIDANPIPRNASVPELSNGRYHRLSSLDHELYKELKDIKDPRRATTQLADRCRRLVTDEVFLPTCGHDAIGRLGMGQQLSDRLVDDVRQAYHDQLRLASAQRPGKGDYGPPEPHSGMQYLYRGSWIATQILEALMHVSAPVPDLPNAAYAVVAAERGAR